METAKKEVAEACEEKRIIFQWNTEGGGSACYYCGARVEFGGLDFFIEGTKEFRVCIDCVKKKAPDLYLIWRDAHRWLEAEKENAWSEGVNAGKAEAGRIVWAAIEESPLDRVRRICTDKLGFEDVPF